MLDKDVDYINYVVLCKRCVCVCENTGEMPSTRRGAGS